MNNFCQIIYIYILTIKIVSITKNFYLIKIFIVATAAISNAAINYSSKPHIFCSKSFCF